MDRRTGPILLPRLLTWEVMNGKKVYILAMPGPPCLIVLSVFFVLFFVCFLFQKKMMDTCIVYLFNRLKGRVVLSVRRLSVYWKPRFPGMRQYIYFDILMRQTSILILSPYLAWFELCTSFMHEQEIKFNADKIEISHHHTRCGPSLKQLDKKKISTYCQLRPDYCFEDHTQQHQQPIYDSRGNWLAG